MIRSRPPHVPQECLDQFIVFGTENFDHLCREYLEHYHNERLHQAMENLPLVAPSSSPRATRGKIVCRERLCGVLWHHCREAT